MSPVPVAKAGRARTRRQPETQPAAAVRPAPPLRLLFWETTKSCNLRCQHCRAVPRSARDPMELTTEESFRLMDQVAEVARPVLVLSGGEPLARPDIFELGAYGRDKGFRMALATNGTLVDRDVARRIRETGSHASALVGIRHLRDEGVSVQINSTVAKHNVSELPELLDLALGLGADALHIFMLVPVGCGVELAETAMLHADEYERVLNWFYDQSKVCAIDLKATCAPHYFRVRAERIVEERRQGDRSTPFVAHGTRLKAASDPAGGPPLSMMTRGCLAGTSVCFVSHVGEVYPCGYLPVTAGSVRQQSFGDIWRQSEVFQALRDPAALGGKCGICRYQAICAGCRARAYAATGDYLAEEPFCTYEPTLDPEG